MQVRRACQFCAHEHRSEVGEPQPFAAGGIRRAHEFVAFLLDEQWQTVLVGNQPLRMDDSGVPIVACHLVGDGHFANPLPVVRIDAGQLHFSEAVEDRDVIRLRAVDQHFAD